MTRGLSCSIRVARFDAAGVGVGSLFGQWGGHILSGCLGLLQSCRGRRGEDGRTGLIARAGAASDGAGKLDNASRRTEHPEHKQTHQPASLVEEIKPHFSCAEYFARGGLRHPRSPPGGRASHQGARHRGHAATSRRVTGRRVPGLGPFFSWISRARAPRRTRHAEQLAFSRITLTTTRAHAVSVIQGLANWLDSTVGDGRLDPTISSFPKTFRI
jgi:hypothetical protein